MKTFDVTRQMLNGAGDFELKHLTIRAPSSPAACRIADDIKAKNDHDVDEELTGHAPRRNPAMPAAAGRRLR